MFVKKDLEGNYEVQCNSASECACVIINVDIDLE